MKKALIAMSGGVDSSVAARLIQDAGYECVGCTMRLFRDGCDGIRSAKTCGAADHAEDARRVTERLGIPFHEFDLTEEFRREVIDRFVSEYLSGRTPNPCVDCNKHLKFSQLLREADALDCEYLVTGHYARIELDPDSGKYLLRKGLDESRDQSYVLYNLTQEQLARTLLPLGGMHKSEVRELAEAHGFINAEKPDSQDICFVPDGKYAAMIERYLEQRENGGSAEGGSLGGAANSDPIERGPAIPTGDFLDLDGNVIGTHKGIIYYTIGQHKRLGQAFGRPRYVCHIDAATNTITLGGPEDVFSADAKADQVNWIAGEPPAEEFRCKVRLRYKQKEQWATVRCVEKTETAGNAEATRSVESAGAAGSITSKGPATSVDIHFDEPQRAITPGQAAVFYDGDLVLGGGTIR